MKLLHTASYLNNLDSYLGTIDDVAVCVSSSATLGGLCSAGFIDLNLSLNATVISFVEAIAR